MKSHWLLLALGLAACSGRAEIPNTPNLTGVERQYDHPTAVIDQAAAEQALQDIPPLEDLAAGFRSSGYATRGLDEAESSASDDEDASLRIQGSIHVTIRCPGTLGEPVFDESTNGKLVLTIGVEESRIKRGIAGSATRCLLLGNRRGLDLPVEIDGPFAFDLGRDISLRQRWAGRLLMVIAGTIRIGDLEFSGLSARFTEDKFEYLFVLPGGENWIVAELTEEGISLRDRDKVWVCPSGTPCSLR